MTRSRRPWLWPVAMVAAWLVLNVFILGKRPLQGCAAGLCPPPSLADPYVGPVPSRP
jgi:hypothetical protein